MDTTALETWRAGAGVERGGDIGRGACDAWCLELSVANVGVASFYHSFQFFSELKMAKFGSLSGFQ
jgi:hypothetical protein